MPSRWMCLTIVAFWLAMTGWLLWQDVWPNWEPGLPPPYAIDMEEEAGVPQVDTIWNVFRNGEDALLARTSVEYREKPDDTFSLKLNLEPRERAKDKAIFARLAQLQYMKSVYRVSRRGELREITLETVFETKAGNVKIMIKGKVQDGYFRPVLQSESLRSLLGDLKLRPVPVSHHGTVLLPLHPVQRIEGLRRGRSWRMPMLNVLEASLNGAPPVVYLNARVLPETQMLPLDRMDYECFIVEYRGDEFQGKTWVDEKTGLVLRQEQTVAGDNWAMQRLTGPSR